MAIEDDDIYRSSAPGELYNQIGPGYAAIRQADPRLAHPIWQSLGDARTVVNVGAGAGSYEPPDREVTAVEPSAVMITQRPPGSAPVVRATAGRLPFPDDSFDAAMAVLTIHHWDDIAAGIREMVRVARRRVLIVTYDPDSGPEQWIIRDYLPEIISERPYSGPPLAELLKLLPGADVQPILVPRDCTDRMFSTLWGRPEQHLDPAVRAATSPWRLVPPAAAERAIKQLQSDLGSGRWDERYGHLRSLDELDVGLRLIRAELS